MTRCANHKAMAPTLADIAETLARLAESPAPAIAEGRWNASQHLQHLSSTLTGPLQGFPKMKPAPLRWIARTLVLPRFLRTATMRHDRNAPLPGVAEPDANRPYIDALADLLTALAAFSRAIDEGAPLRPHPFFGALDADRYARYQAIHLADHLQLFSPGASRSGAHRAEGIDE